MNFKRISIIENNQSLFKPNSNIESLADDIKAILSNHLNNGITLSKADETQTSNQEFSVDYKDDNVILDKNTLQNLINHPNFKGISTNSILFKSDIYLKEE